MSERRFELGDWAGEPTFFLKSMPPSGGAVMSRPVETLSTTAAICWSISKTKQTRTGDEQTKELQEL